MSAHTDLSRVSVSTAPSPATSGTTVIVTDANAALSTANNSASNRKLVGRAVAVGTTGIGGFINREDILTIASKTLYYLNTYTSYSNTTNIYFTNDIATLSIKAVCAYL